MTASVDVEQSGPAPAGPDPAWWDEIDLDPERPWLAMATRSLGGRPWLVVDDRRRRELALKATLTATRHDEVFAALAGTAAPSEVVLDLVEAELAQAQVCVDAVCVDAVSVDAGDRAAGLHPLDRAGRLVQEDLCLLRRSSEGWLLVAGSLCFPSRWRLAHKLGRPLTAVHGPVEGYEAALASKVDRLLDRLGDRIVWRRNWFVHPDPALFQPDRPAGGDPIVPTSRCLDDLHLRSERQTLRRIDDDHVLFTIRIQQDPLRCFAAAPARRASLARFLTEASEGIGSHHGLVPAQRARLLAALDHGPTGSAPDGRSARIGQLTPRSGHN